MSLKNRSEAFILRRKNINICRNLLYAGYGIAKSTGILRYVNRNREEASILLFHRVNDLGSDSMSTTIDLFETIIKRIKQYYMPISLQSIIEKIYRKEKFDHGSVAITFDDGYRDNLINVVPILEKYQVPATFFVTSGYVGTNRLFPWDNDNGNKFENLTWDDIRYMRKKGFEIGSHTVNHVNLGEVSIETARREIRVCKEKIEAELGERIDKFAYPYGRRDAMREEIIQVLKENEFICCLSGYGGKVDRDSDLFHLNRIAVYPSLIELSMDIDNFHTYYNGRMIFFGKKAKCETYAANRK